VSGELLVEWLMLDTVLDRGSEWLDQVRFFKFKKVGLSRLNLVKK